MFGLLWCTSSAGEWGFNDFLRRGLIEYLDVNEENVSLIALYEQNCTPRVRNEQGGPDRATSGKAT
jgi:hypothetical protein